jgi:hypothetical protein
MSDDDDTNVTIFPVPKRGRRRMTVPDGMPVVEDARGSERERLAAWMRERFSEIERIHAERVELLRTVGEHPSPVFAKIVRIDGALGMPKSLVAKKLGITTATFDIHYGDDYAMGAMEIMSSVAANALRIATSTCDPAAAATALKVLDRRGGPEWKPPAQQVEVENKDAPPIIDSSKMTPEERQQMRIMLTRITEGGGDEVEFDGEAK